MIRPRREGVLYWTRNMLKGAHKLPITVTIKVTPRIIRKGLPETGALCFDDGGRLVYIIANSGPNRWTWRRVITDGSLSENEYSGHWQRGHNQVAGDILVEGEHARMAEQGS